MPDDPSPNLPGRVRSLLSGLTQDMRLVEIGPSHNPAAPKRDGWNTVVVDYADADTLRQHYKNVAWQRIEPVDVVWSEGALVDAFDPSSVGTFDAIISSHSLEHIPDAIRFLVSCEQLIRPGGKVRLALPDKRCCFDFFRAPSTTGDMLAAYARRAIVHNKATSFNEVAYAVKNNGRGSWPIGHTVENLEFIHPLKFANSIMQRATDGTSGPYYDFHAWQFTPSSFSLIILELWYLGYIGLEITDITETLAQEFFVTLHRAPERVWDDANVQQERLSLLRKILLDLGHQLQAVAL
jgi:SAM-dependent methyltransferase